ncbi:PREDICTED: nuclear pore glycoprotein p62-like [Elephantulus edwardii]|uniref:nuclear pore glycoprotein p62-like n=1 Tax=Elephantulus edwardii TaxID=28737 RepID=UPI0003F0AFF7|nr:PREDICTED: nuclear pore glycoprotein p62-like [Elephantulus edwardii]
MTYGMLDGLIDKWSLDLEDHEKYFLHQATQVNAWDRTLLENGEKIITLHGEVEKMKKEQKRLEQELDFILSQQNELEDLLIPLEESVKDQSEPAYLQYADEERDRTYKLAENIDTQLKQMAQDLKDIIEHLNTFQSPADNTDPLQQVCKILNAHMDSLHRIDHNSGGSLLVYQAIGITMAATPVGISTSSTQLSLSKYHTSKKNQDFLEKYFISDLMQGKE